MLKRVTINFSFWNDIIKNDIIIPEDKIWYQDFSITNSTLRRGWCNYWTVFNEEEFEQFRTLNAKIRYRKYKLVDKYIICIDNIEPSDSFKTTNNKSELLDQLDLDNTIIIGFDEQYNVHSITKLRDFNHPYYSYLDTIRFFQIPPKIDTLAAISQIKDNLTTESNYLGRIKYAVIKDVDNIWQEAINYVAAKVNNEPYDSKYIWRHGKDVPEYDLKEFIFINKEVEIIPDTKAPLEYWSWIEIRNNIIGQFGLKYSDLR